MSWTVAACDECHVLVFEPEKPSPEIEKELQAGLRRHKLQSLAWPWFFGLCPLCKNWRIFRGREEWSYW